MEQKTGSSMMTDAASENNALEALKAFNTAVTTTRLYPADAPQVPASAEKAYQAIKRHLRKNGDLVFSIENGEGMLCGSPIQKQTLGKLHGADVFQHLRLLNLSCAVIHPGLDRKLFKQILSFFTTPLQKIKNEGGGQSFAIRTGLADVFPEGYTVMMARDDGDNPDKVLDSFSQSFSDTRKEVIDYFSGIADDEEIGREIVQDFMDPDRAARTITACIVNALQEIWKKEAIELSPVFEKIQKNIDEYLNQTQKEAVALKTADLLLQGLKGPLLAVLFCQDMPNPFGEALFQALMARIGIEDFRRITEFLQKRGRVYAEKFGEGSTPYHLVKKTTTALLDTVRGRQYLALEKTRSLLEEGEKERRKKRIQAGINAIFQGKIAVLENDEIVGHLPHIVERLLANSKDEIAAQLIEKLAKELLKGNKKIETKVSQSLSSIGTILVEAEKWDWLEKLSGPFLRWVKEVDKADPVYDGIVTVLQQVMQHGYRIGNNKTADQILNVMFAIRSGLIQKSPEVCKITGNIQDRFVDKTLLGSFLSSSIANPVDELLGQRISMQGPVAARFLITNLTTSENAGERIRILDLLANMGPLLPEVLVEKLPEPMPWFGKRNLLKLLAETGSEEHSDAALPFLNHDDLRVQREAFVCLYKISGGKRKRVLLNALSLAGETMKVQIVKALVPLVDDDVVESLVELLQDQEHFSVEVRGPLIQQVCRALSHSASKSGLAALEKLLSHRRKGKAKKLDPAVWRSAEMALQQMHDNLEEKNRQSASVQEQTGGTSGFPMNELEGEQLITNFPEEQQVRAYLEQGNKAKAKALLSILIGKTAGMRQFVQAEKLREWLIDIDPTALTSILQAAEIIENEKCSSIDKDHLETWHGLYEIMSTEEFNTLYYSFEQKKYDAEEIIIKQGTILPALFFINSGRIRLFSKEDDAETLCKIIGRGEVLGASSFFSSSVWTINAAALGYTEVSVLDQEKTENWFKDYPALEAKLADYCMKFDGLKDFFQTTGRERRAYEREKATGKIALIILDRYGKDTGITSKGDLVDISIGGISFLVHMSQKRNARLLLGRNVRIVFSVKSLESENPFKVAGLVVAVSLHKTTPNEYFVHIRFDNPIRIEDMQEIVDAAKQEH